MKRARILQRGIITDRQKGDNFLLRLLDIPIKVIAYPCGTIRRNNIYLCIGDEVEVELSPYNLKNGRILWRHSEEL
ncbi:MAG: translation initiation factor IF-1 [Candidatus Poribacteria bacterium]|nr:translation initiation factor IF-1 [Candidatus Poribacteria bacterium]